MENNRERSSNGGKNRKNSLETVYLSTRPDERSALVASIAAQIMIGKSHPHGLILNNEKDRRLFARDCVRFAGIVLEEAETYVTGY